MSPVCQANLSMGAGSFGSPDQQMYPQHQEPASDASSPEPLTQAGGDSSHSPDSECHVWPTPQGKESDVEKDSDPQATEGLKIEPKQSFPENSDENDCRDSRFGPTPLADHSPVPLDGGVSFEKGIKLIRKDLDEAKPELQEAPGSELNYSQQHDCASSESTSINHEPIEVSNSDTESVSCLVPSGSSYPSENIEQRTMPSDCFSTLSHNKANPTYDGEKQAYSPVENESIVDGCMPQNTGASSKADGCDSVAETLHHGTSIRCEVPSRSSTDAIGVITLLHNQLPDSDKCPQMDDPGRTILEKQSLDPQQTEPKSLRSEEHHVHDQFPRAVQPDLDIPPDNEGNDELAKKLHVSVIGVKTLFPDELHDSDKFPQTYDPGRTTLEKHCLDPQQTEPKSLQSEEHHVHEKCPRAVQLDLSIPPDKEGNDSRETIPPLKSKEASIDWRLAPYRGYRENVEVPMDTLQGPEETHHKELDDESTKEALNASSKNAVYDADRRYEKSCWEKIKMLLQVSSKREDDHPRLAGWFDDKKMEGAKPTSSKDTPDDENKSKASETFMPNCGYLFDLRRPMCQQLLAFPFFGASVSQDMAVEAMRLQTFLRYPRECNFSTLRLANAGFYYPGQGDAVECYSCGVTFNCMEENEQEDPYQIHRRLSPACPHVSGQDSRSIFVQDSQRQAQSPLDITGQGDGEAPSRLADFQEIIEATREDLQRMRHQLAEMGITFCVAAASEASQQPAPVGTGNGGSVSSAAVAGSHGPSTGSPGDATPHEAVLAVSGSQSQSVGGQLQAVPPPPASTLVALAFGASPLPASTQAPSNLAASSATASTLASSTLATSTFAASAPGASAPAASTLASPTEDHLIPGLSQVTLHPGDMQEPIPSDIYDPSRAQHRNYTDRSRRQASFSTWPETHAQSPEALALCGFFYAGTGDCVRCHYCGLGLKHWDPDDRPLDEHVRWRSSCGYVRALLEASAITRILAALANPEGAENSGYGQIGTTRSQVPVPRPAAPMQTTATVAAAAAVSTTPARPVEPAPSAASLMTSAAAQSARDMGFTDDAIRRAITALLGTRAGVRAVTPQNLVHAILYIRERGQSDVREVEVSSDSDSAGEDDIPSPPSPEPASTSTSTTTTTTTSTSTSTPTASCGNSPGLSPPAGGASARGSSGDQRSGSPVTGTSAAGSGGNSSPDVERTAQQLEQENQELRERRRCKICLDNDVSILFLPCGHLVCCPECAAALLRCPICRIRIRGRVRTEMAPIPSPDDSSTSNNNNN